MLTGVINSSPPRPPIVRCILVPLQQWHLHFIQGITTMRSRPMVLAVFVLAMSCFFLPPAKAQQPVPAPRAITVDDVFELRDVRDPQITADGKWVAYTISTMSLKEDKTETRVWTVQAAGGDPMVMTVPKESSSHPRWSADGKYLAFLSKRGEGKTQVWLLNRMGGEAEQLTETVQDRSEEHTSELQSP